MNAVLDRLARSFDVTETCWEWTASRNGAGYGKFYANGRYNTAHRFVFEMFCGPIPTGLTLDHLCRVRHCVNPAHLDPVTQRENTLRGVGPSALHAKVTHCPKGHKYEGDNLYWIGSHRKCRACGNEGTRNRRRRLSEVRRPEYAEWEADLGARRKPKTYKAPTSRGCPIPGAVVECPVCHDFIGYWPDKLNPYLAYLMPHSLVNNRCEGREGRISHQSEVGW